MNKKFEPGNGSRDRDETIKGTNGLTIYGVLRAWAEATPEATALISPGNEPIAYRQLFTQVESIINSLSLMGIARDDRIAIILPNCLEMAIMFLGVSCVAISAPLNPSYRKNEIEFYLSDLPAKALIVPTAVDSPPVTAAQRLAIPIVELTPSAESHAVTLKGPKLGSAALYRLPKPDDTALILYTSGTTSNPKKIPLTQNNLCASAFNIKSTLSLTNADRCLGLMPLFHIHGLVGGLLSSLAAGSSVVVGPDFDSHAFFDWMKELTPTWYTAVPTIHQAVLNGARDQGESLRSSRLRFIRSSSASLPGRVMAELEEVFKVPVIEAYGMTEASHQITSNPLPPSRRKPGSVGVPGETEVAVVDEAGNFLPVGETGEIVINGVNVTSGYEAKDEPIEKAFTKGWFCTGDQGYFDSDGYLFITGRLKEIINRGGEKISPREIDEALLEHPDVLQAVTFPIPHPSLGEDIGAAVVVQKPTLTSEAKIRDYLIGRLADFKIPSQLLIVDDIPKGSTGKVLRLGLAEKFAEHLETDFVAPKNNLEARVANIFAEVLGTRQVSASANFLALGGDSLRATQVISRVRSLFAVDLPIATVFTKTTAAELAKEIAGALETHNKTPKAAIFAELKVLEENTQTCVATRPDELSSPK